MAVLEAVARGANIPTRVRGLVVDGRFWYPRFPRLQMVVPDRVLLAWPDFFVDGHWVNVTHIFPTRTGSRPFSNAGGETLYDSVRGATIDWVGECDGATCDLSGWVVDDLGRFDSRDALFDTHGQTLSGLAVLVTDPIMSRWSPKAVGDNG